MNTGVFYRALKKLGLMGFGVLLALIVNEGFLRLVDYTLPLSQRFNMPREWERRDLNQRDYLWQGQLHRFNRDGFRGPDWGPKSPKTLRILALGASFTYGMGVAEDQAYPSRIEKKLGTHYRVEVLNLGVYAAHSEDILRIAKRTIPRYKPDIVLYGIGLSDYLPSGRGKYYRWGSHTLKAPKQFHSHLSEFFIKRSIDILLRLNILHDFIQDAMEASSVYATRFSKDLKALNDYALSNGCPPVLAMVVYPEAGNENIWQLMALTEKIANNAGMTVVPAEDYQLAWTGRKRLGVSHWETHPNAEAHEMFAVYFVKGLYKSSAYKDRMASFRREKETDPGV